MKDGKQGKSKRDFATEALELQRENARLKAELKEERRAAKPVATPATVVLSDGQMAVSREIRENAELIATKRELGRAKEELGRIEAVNRKLEQRLETMNSVKTSLEVTRGQIHEFSESIGNLRKELKQKEREFHEASNTIGELRQQLEAAKKFKKSAEPSRENCDKKPQQREYKPWFRENSALVGVKTPSPGDAQ